jgi:DNA polymerase-3 subunit gamma/tau
MLGLADRGQSMALCRQLLRGEMKAALETFGVMQQAGSDPLQILQDMCELVHLLTRGQAIAGFAQDAGLPEYDRQLLTELSDIKIPALARGWQILLKGIGEVQIAAHPAQAAEMVLIRLAYASDLPPPAELIKQLRDGVAAGGTGASTSSPSGNPAPRAKMAGGGAVATQAIATQALPDAQISAQPAPTSYRGVVALFSTNREGALHAQLYSNVHPVRCEAGLLEIHVGEHAPSNLASRLSQCLTQWTGQRWMVSISERKGEPSLAEIDQAAEKKRQDEATAHPLMQAVITSFPGAKMTALKRKTIAPTVAVVEDATAIDSDTTFDTTYSGD